MVAQLARESDIRSITGSELVSNSLKLDWHRYRIALCDRLDALGQLDGVALMVEASTLHSLLARGRELLGPADPFAQEAFDRSTPTVVLLRALARIARIRPDELVTVGEVVKG